MPEPDSAPDTADVVIIGGGLIGLSIAYGLVKLRVSDVLLIERHQLTSGASWHAAGIVGPLRASVNQTRLAMRALELLPALCTEGLTGGLWVSEDGQANPVDICMAYAKGARAGGARLLEQHSCTGITSKQGRLTGVSLRTAGHPGQREVRCRTVINCAGAWAAQVGSMADVPIPLQAVEHPLLLHDEPIVEAGRAISHLTSGGRGFRTNLSLCFAYLPCAPGDSRASLASRRFEVLVGGTPFPLRMLRQPAYDPRSHLLRAGFEHRSSTDD